MDYGAIIFNTVNGLGIPVALSNLVAAQSAHETNNYTSDVFLHCNNAFGYKWVNQRYALGPCLQSPEGDYYASYASIQQSAQEIAAWIYRRVADGTFPQDLNMIQTPTQYAGYLLNAGYFTDSLANYVTGLTRYFVDHKGVVIASTGVLVTALWIWVSYRYIKKHSRSG
jgi:hypothetical protein